MSSEETFEDQEDDDDDEEEEEEEEEEREIKETSCGVSTNVPQDTQAAWSSTVNQICDQDMCGNPPVDACSESDDVVKAKEEPLLDVLFSPKNPHQTVERMYENIKEEYPSEKEGESKSKVVQSASEKDTNTSLALADSPEAGSTLENNRESLSVNPETGLLNSDLGCATVLDSVCDNGLSLAEGPVTSSSCDVTSSELVLTNAHEQPIAQLTDTVAHVPHLTICRDTILEEERTANIEFFMGRSPKTPDRYVKIRNYILDMWERTQPNYLYKTSLRAGLRNCGDVNSIGRVHCFLEDVGAINVGCSDRPPTRTRHRSEASEEQPDLIPLESWVNSLRPRKRKVRSEQGDWIDESEAEGLTIEVCKGRVVTKSN